MVSKKNVSGGSLIFRLLAWYSLALLIMFSIIFTLLFFDAKKTLHSNASKRLEAEIAALVSAYRSEGMQELDKVIIRTAYSHGISEVCYAVLDANGSILLSSDMSQWAGLVPDKDLIAQAVRQNLPTIRNIKVEGIQPSVQIAYAPLGPNKILRTAMVLRYTDAYLANLQTQLVITAIIVMLTVTAVGWITLHFVINRVTDVTKTALAIPSTSMNKRVPVSGNGDEIDKLAHAFNGMLDRIELLIKGLSEVTENVAHDLKSPLTRIRIIAESLTKAGEIEEPTKLVIADIVEESDRLLEMINTTLEMKAIDMGAASLKFASIDLSKIVLDACELFEMIAQDKGVVLNVHSDGSSMVNGDLRHLQRAFSNIIDNAIKYTEPDGKVEVQIKPNSSNINIIISDNGPGIDPASINKIFERFYRADASRHHPGLGLGLSLAESIIKAHGGRITVESTVGIGSKFTVILPRSSGKIKK